MSRHSKVIARTDTHTQTDAQTHTHTHRQFEKITFPHMRVVMTRSVSDYKNVL